MLCYVCVTRFKILSFNWSNEQILFNSPVQLYFVQFTVCSNGSLGKMINEELNFIQLTIWAIKMDRAMLPCTKLHMRTRTQELIDVHTLGRLRSGASFPASLKLRPLGDATKIQVSVFHNLSGLVVLNSDGKIESANSHFTNLLFGYGSEDLKGKVRAAAAVRAGRNRCPTLFTPAHRTSRDSSRRSTPRPISTTVP